MRIGTFLVFIVTMVFTNFAFAQEEARATKTVQFACTVQAGPDEIYQVDLWLSQEEDQAARISSPGVFRGMSGGGVEVVGDVAGDFSATQMHGKIETNLELRKLGDTSGLVNWSYYETIRERGAQEGFTRQGYCTSFEVK